MALTEAKWIEVFRDDNSMGLKAGMYRVVDFSNVGGWQVMDNTATIHEVPTRDMALANFAGECLYID
jgi:hypothetical protein